LKGQKTTPTFVQVMGFAVHLSNRIAKGLHKLIPKFEPENLPEDPIKKQK
jgi:hypothetical protein